MSKYQITKQQLQNLIVEERYHRVDGTTVILCSLILKNGYVANGESGCIDPTIFNEEIGKEIAYDNAFDQLWKIVGYQEKQRWYNETQLDWKGRVGLELAELEERIGKLQTALKEPQPIGIDDTQCYLMHKQLEAMKTYATILKARLE